MDKISKKLEKPGKKFDVITLNFIELIKKKEANILISYFSKQIAKIHYLV